VEASHATIITQVRSERSPLADVTRQKLRREIPGPYADLYMTLGKARPKLLMSWSSRKLRLGVSHHGTASSWTAPTKDAAPAENRGGKAQKKRR
jgi:hypothetical protein